MKRHSIKLQIGDWSNDGHGRCETFILSSTKDGKGIRAAYKKAKEKLPKCIDPANIFDDYGDSSLTQKVYEETKKRGYNFLEGFENDPDRPEGETHEERLEYPQVGPEDFAEYVVWFLHQGDESLDLKIQEPDLEDVFPSYGEDGFGYGLFGS